METLRYYFREPRSFFPVVQTQDPVTGRWVDLPVAYGWQDEIVGAAKRGLTRDYYLTSLLGADPPEPWLLPLELRPAVLVVPAYWWGLVRSRRVWDCAWLKFSTLEDVVVLHWYAGLPSLLT